MQPSLIDTLSDAVKSSFERCPLPLLGAWTDVKVIGDIRGLQILLGASLLLATLAVSYLLDKVILRGKPAAESGLSATLSWPFRLSELLPVVRRPAKLLVWTWGLFGVWILLFESRAEAQPAWFSPVISGIRWAVTYGTLFWCVFRLSAVLEAAVNRRTARQGAKWDDVLLKVATRAFRLVLPLLGFLLVIPMLSLPPAYHDSLKQIASLILTGGVGFILYDLVLTAERAVLSEFRIDQKDNLVGRKMQTKVRVLKRIVIALIVLITAALMLMVFEPVRQLGKSILASAGVAGIILGFAAQRSLATLFAGLQIAFTQPIRIDDVVIVEGEWGRIEEITMSYVVVLIWDLRRLIVPITYFIEKPFQNWTRVNANILGTVMLYVDYTVETEPLRAELDRILEESKLWDRKVKVLQVTDAKEHTLELRVLVSAADAGDAFDLRCQVRERLITYLQKNYPQCLPRIRTQPLSAAGDPLLTQTVSAQSGF